MRSLDPAEVHRWAGELAERGHRPIPLAAGVEGAVFRLGGGAVAKVWNSRTEAEIDRLALFYRAVTGAGLPFRTPEIQDVGHLRDAVFSIERELPGAPLWPDHAGVSPPLDPRRIRCLAEVLAALAAVTPTAGMTLLPVLDEPEPLRLDNGFDNALGDLVVRRVERFRDRVRVAVPDIGELAAALVDRLATLGPSRPGLIHGDLIPANVLVDEDGRVTAVLDFGFFSTAGPPAFDAAVTVNVFDMYGPARDASRTAVATVVEEMLGHPPQVLAVYLAGYAMATMMVFGGGERDGHFRWCADVLRRPEVLNALQ